MKAGLALKITVPEGDPISTSGYFQGDIMINTRDHLSQILQVRLIVKEKIEK